MNLKKQKLNKHIQELKRVSRGHTQKNKAQQKRIEIGVERAVQEKQVEQAEAQNMQNHGLIGDTPRMIKSKKKHGSCSTGSESEENAEQVVYIEDEAQNVNNGYIQLDQQCYRLQPQATQVPQAMKDDDAPTILDIKGSICTDQSRYNMIGKIARSLGFKVVKLSKLWNILWVDSLPGVELYKNMKRFQQINHFPGMVEICRKDLLSRNLNRMLKLFPNDYKIFPRTWVFPADYGEALNFSLSTKGKNQMFIIKPDAGARGRGIWLTSDLKNVKPTDRMICQMYIEKPLLIDGYKFDLRVYALITSVNPLRIFVYNEGLARFATSKYVEPSAENSTDLYMHLTNYSVNKRNSQYDFCDHEECGSKRRFKAINNLLLRCNYDPKIFWANIDDIVIKTVLSAWPMLKHNYRACFPGHDTIQACFEILGVDILVDSKMRPFILEVNHSPSFHTHEEVDKQVKRPLIRDTLSLVATALADKQKIMREDRKRVKQRLLRVKTTNNNVRTTATNPNERQTAGAANNTAKGPQRCPLSPIAQQIAWEESHLGNFRRIMPPHDSAKSTYYSQFFALQNQSSIYGETVSSKKREDLARKMRSELEAKRMHQEALVKRWNGLNNAERLKQKTEALPRAIAEKKRLRRMKRLENWSPAFISEPEERLRSKFILAREKTIKDLKIFEHAYQYLYRSGNLNPYDIANYPDLYRSFENGVQVLDCCAHDNAHAEENDQSNQ